MISRTLPTMEQIRSQRAWGKAWLLLGLLTCAGTVMIDHRDGLLWLILFFYLTSIFAVGLVSRDVAKALGQLVLAFLALCGSTMVFISSSIEPMVVVPVWFGVVAGAANLFVGARLSLLALLGHFKDLLGSLSLG